MSSNGMPAGPAAAAQAARLAHTVSERLAPLRKTKDADPLAGPVVYPDGNDTADRLKLLAGLLAQPLGIRVAGGRRRRRVRHARGPGRDAGQVQLVRG